MWDETLLAISFLRQKVLTALIRGNRKALAIGDAPASHPELVWREQIGLAKTGDPQAIAALMNRHLQAQGMHAEARLWGDCLWVMLEAAHQAPDAKTWITFVHQGVSNLKVPKIKFVTVLGRIQGQRSPLWNKTLSLGLSVQELETLADWSSLNPAASHSNSVNLEPNALTDAESQPSPSHELLAQYEAGIRNFQGIDLQRANLQSWSLSQADFTDANLSGADLRGANLSHAQFCFANLSGAQLTACNLRGANLQGANLEGANLQGADLGWTVMAGVNLINANLAGANLLSANLVLATLPDGTLLD
jgi:hypothetical protein